MEGFLKYSLREKNCFDTAYGSSGYYLDFLTIKERIYRITWSVASLHRTGKACYDKGRIKKRKKKYNCRVRNGGKGGIRTRVRGLP